MSLAVISLILLCTIFNTVAQIALKYGMQHIGVFAFHWQNVFPISLQVVTSPWIILGVITYVGSLVSWLLVLSRVPVSIAYPLSSLAYITNAIAAYYIFGENVSATRIAGTLVILLGVFLVARS